MVLKCRRFNNLGVPLKVQSDNYVGISADGTQSVYINVHGGEKLKIILKFFSVTEDTQIPFYVGQNTKVIEEKDVAFEKVVLNTTASNEVKKVRTLKTRSNDGIVWLASVGEESAVGINTIDKNYDSIAIINLTSKDALWYDGVKAGLKHRVIETKHSRGYNHLTSPSFTSVSKDIVYAGRVETKSTAEDGVSTFKDYVSKNNDDIADYSHSPVDASGARPYSSGQGLPTINLR